MNKLAYVCSPYSGNIQANIEFARKCCRRVMERGYVPIAPHLLFPQFMSEETEREKAIDLGLQLLAKCAVLWICGRYVSDGMRQEIEEAERLGIEVKHLETVWQDGKLR